MPTTKENFNKLEYIKSKLLFVIRHYEEMDFPGGTLDKNLPANAGDRNSAPGLGEFHMPQSN